MTKVIESPLEFKKIRSTFQGTTGFVPTMGALHDGHATLLKRSRSENNVSVLSIFVNPTQFNDPNDLKKYPRTFESDLALAEKVGVDFIFAPTYETLYQDQYRYKISENELSQKFCGSHRPGHFDGVLSVVMKLFNIVEPTRAYFGEKDYQQLKLIEGMAQSFFMNVQIVPVPTVRESSGLAMSSRNIRLNPSDRKIADQLNHILRNAKNTLEAQQQLESVGFRVDYVEDWNHRRLAAAFLGEVRLIDNVEI